MNLNNDIQDCIQSIITSRILFAGSAITKNHEIDNTLDTAATDGISIYYNESFFYSLNYKQRITLICHELLHILLGHHLRLRGRDHELWNAACDYVINLILVDMGFEHLNNWLINYSYKGMSAEDVYNELSNQSKVEQDQQKQQSKESGGSFKEPTNESGDELSEAELKEAEGQAEQDARQAKSQLTRRVKGIEKSEALTAKEKENQLKEIGKGFSDITSRLNDIKHTRIDWKNVIQRFLNEETTSQLDLETFDFYNMENQDFELIENARKSEEFGKVAFCMDVSGSLCRMAKEVCSEAFHGLEQTQRNELLTYYISDQIHSKKVITNANDLEEVRGYGTDFNCFFNVECLKQDFTAKGIIFVTDGYVDTNWIDPQIPVLFILTRSNEYFEKTVPFGECVRML